MPCPQSCRYAACRVMQLRADIMGHTVLGCSTAMPHTVWTGGLYSNVSPTDDLRHVSRQWCCDMSCASQAAAEGDAQTAASAASAAGCSPWFMAHTPLLLAASPRGAAAMSAPLQHAGGDQVPTLWSFGQMLLCNESCSIWAATSGAQPVVRMHKVLRFCIDQ
jgi:hypothetical protein